MGCDLPSPGGLGLLLGVYFLSSWNQGLGLDLFFSEGGLAILEAGSLNSSSRNPPL